MADKVDKAGKVLSATNAKKLVEAMRGLMKIVQSAGIEELMAEGDAGETKMMAQIRQEEANYTTVSPQTGTQQCANCRWFQAYTWQEGLGSSGASCYLIQPWPEAILATGYCDRWEAPAEYDMKPEPLEVVIVEAEAEADKALYITPAPLSMWRKGLKRLTGSLREGVTLTKGADGLRLAIIVTSNGYRDREDEFVLTKALKGYVESCWNEQGKYVGNNILKFWHLLDIGDIVWTDIRSDTFLVEVAKESDHPLAKVVWDYWEAHPDELNAASQGFKATEVDRQAYTAIEKQETSVLPRSAAANALTLSGVVPMAKSRAQLLNEMFQIEDAAETLEKEGLNALMTKLAKRGVIHRSASTAKDKDDKAKSQDFAPLVQDLIESQADLAQAVDALTEKDASREKALSDKEAAHDTQIKALTDTVKALADTVNKVATELRLTPRRASMAPETVMSDEEAQVAKDKLPKDNDPFWAKVGLDVPTKGGNGHASG